MQLKELITSLGTTRPWFRCWLVVGAAAALWLDLRHTLAEEAGHKSTAPPKVEIGKVEVSKLPPPADKKIIFGRDIQPIFKKSCLDCHDADGPMGKFRLDKREFALKGGESGVAIKPGKSAESTLIHFVAQLVKDMEMPPKDQGEPLTREQIGLLRAWIDQGAKWD